MIDVDDALRRLSATLTHGAVHRAGVDFEGKLDGIYRGITEAVADKGYHNNQVMVDLWDLTARRMVSAFFVQVKRRAALLQCWR